MHTNNSFPSGHTACAFAIWITIAIGSSNRAIQGLCIFIAAMVGWSRIYLGQHFLEDVLAGSIIGIATAIASHFFSNWLLKKGYLLRYIKP
jgi:membrane-associated phospholipid phosphatase